MAVVETTVDIKDAPSVYRVKHPKPGDFLQLVSMHYRDHTAFDWQVGAVIRFIVVGTDPKGFTVAWSAKRSTNRLLFSKKWAKHYEAHFVRLRDAR